MNDVGAIELAGAALGSVTLATLISWMVDALVDYVPQIDGRWAVGAVDGMATVTLLLLYVGVEVDWSAGATWVALFVMWFAVRTMARGIFEHKRSQMRKHNGQA